VGTRVRVPLLCMKGRILANNGASTGSGQEIKLLSDYPLARFNWPQFHNGVAAGLQCTDEDTVPSPDHSVHHGCLRWLISKGVVQSASN